jgi:hypothetical protein
MCLEALMVVAVARRRAEDTSTRPMRGSSDRSAGDQRIVDFS